MAARTRNAAPAPEPEPQGEAPTTAVTTTTASNQAQVTVSTNPQVTAFRKVQAALEARSDALLAVLPGKVGVDRFMRVALGAMSRQPRLFDCTTESLVKSMLDAAELGLEPSGLMGQAYLVPHRNNRAGTTEATLIIGYRGLAELARRSGQVANVEARAVRQRDVFQVAYGSTPSITHVPYLPGAMGAPMPGADDAPVDGAGPFIAFYAVLTMKDGTTIIDVMTVAEVDAIRKRSRSKDDGPWVTDYAEMGRKTVLRRALKYAPVSIVDMRVAEALDREDQAQFGQGDPMRASVQVATTTAPAITAAAASFRLAASGQDAPVPVQEAPGQVEAFQGDQDATGDQGDDPGPSTGFTPAGPAADIGVTMTGHATGVAGPARHEGESDQDYLARVQPVVPQQRQDVDPATGEVLSADNSMVACENPSPYGDGDVCLMPKGHRGAHRSTGGTW